MRRIALPLIAVTLAAACGKGETSTTTSTAPPAATTIATETTVGVPADSTTSIGVSGLGDPYFPNLGNVGYDVTHYRIDMHVDPSDASLDATTTITARATEPLASFSLDLVGLEVHSVRVNGVTSPWDRQGAKLIVSPPNGVTTGEFTVTVEYSGRPVPVLLPSVGVEIGWTQTPEGIWVAAEPDAARTWFPSNDHPSDKATFSFRITVPTPLTAVANGRLVASEHGAASQTFAWSLDSPAATYLATVAIGDYDRVESPGPDGVVIRDYLPASFGGELPQALQITTEAIEFLQEWFGPFPFDRYGHVVVYQLGGALETQTMTLIGNRALLPQVVVHEIAHQWWGDYVTPADWSDIWLNEGFATFAEFLWTEHRDGTGAMLQQIRGLHDALSTIDHRAIADPTQAELLGPAVYWRGAMTLHALRTEIGDELLKQVFSEYASRFGDGNASTEDFISLVEELAEQDLTPLWDAWLRADELPALP